MNMKRVSNGKINWKLRASSLFIKGKKTTVKNKSSGRHLFISYSSEFEGEAGGYLKKI